MQQLEMLNYMRRFHLDDQSAILEKVHATLFIYVWLTRKRIERNSDQHSNRWLIYLENNSRPLCCVGLWNSNDYVIYINVAGNDDFFPFWGYSSVFTVAPPDGRCQLWKCSISFVFRANSGDRSKEGVSCI